MIATVLFPAPKKVHGSERKVVRIGVAKVAPPSNNRDQEFSKIPLEADNPRYQSDMCRLFCRAIHRQHNQKSELTRPCAQCPGDSLFHHLQTRDRVGYWRILSALPSTQSI